MSYELMGFHHSIRTLSELATDIYIGHTHCMHRPKESDNFEGSEQEDSYPQQIKAKTSRIEIQKQISTKTEMLYDS